MTALLRILGVEVMAELGRRLPGRWARILSALMLVGANLLPIWAVLEGRLGMGDVLLIYWFENLVIWFTTTVRILTTTRKRSSEAFGKPLFAAQARLEEKSWVTGDASLAFFFALHFGIFTLVHGIFSLVLAGMAGVHGSPLDWIATIGAILLSHAFSLGLNWFGRGERSRVSAGWAMAAPYPRMLALHLAVILGFFFLGGPDGRTSNDLGAVAVLMGAKTILDLLFHLAEHLIIAGRTAPDGLTGPRRESPAT